MSGGMNLSFIGGGAMAEAMIRGVLAQSLAKPENIYVGEISEERCRYLTDAYRIYASPRNEVAASKGELVVLAVKPQNFQEVASELRSYSLSQPNCTLHHRRPFHVHSLPANSTIQLPYGSCPTPQLRSARE